MGLQESDHSKWWLRRLAVRRTTNRIGPCCHTGAPGAISPEEFASLEKSRNNVVFIDVRTGEEAATGVLKDAQHIPLDKLADATSSLPKDKEIILYCANGIRAQMGYELLSKQGFKTRYLNENITVDKSGNYKM